MSSLLVHLDHAEVCIGSRVLVSTGDTRLCVGERVALMGPSGAGKSLMLAALSGRLRPPLSLRPGTRHEARPLRIGLIPQRGHDALHPLDRIGRQLMSVTRRSRADVVDTLGRTGLDGSLLWNRRPAELSGGQAQRVAIALALLGSPDLVLADEPTSALDPDTRNETLALIDRLLRDLDGPALVIATHDPEVPERLGARVIALHGGRVLDASGPSLIGVS